VIPPNPQQDGEVEIVDVENCIDELNDLISLHLKRTTNFMMTKITTSLFTLIV
jgi:hypothetical protein